MAGGLTGAIGARSWVALVSVLVLVIGLNGVMVLSGWDTTWDDSAITLAFSRTLAETGEIKGNALSERVEGYSTTLWMLIQACVYLVLQDPWRLLAAAKIQTWILNAVNTVLVCLVARRLKLPLQLILAAALVFGTASITLIESGNGMETPLFLLLYMLSFLSYGLPSRWGRALFVTASTLFMLTRWEAAWFLLPFVVVSVGSEGRRGVLRVEHAVWLVVFAASSAWRWAYFGAPVPNTIYAKSHAPYSYQASSWPDWLMRHVEPLSQLLMAHRALLAALAVTALLAALAARGRTASASWRAWSPRRLAESGWGLVALMLLAAGLFNFIVGLNWGPKNRFFFIVLPFCIVSILAVYSLLARHLRGWPAALAAAAMAGAVVFTMASGIRGALWYQRSNDVTIAGFLTVLQAVEEVQQAAERGRITYAGPDMGAILLFAGNMRVVDIGLLCNGRLARKGYDGFESYLMEEVDPDVIEARHHWIKAGGLEDLESFVGNYRVVFVNGIRLFVRRDLLQSMSPGRLQPGEFDRDGRSPAYDEGHFMFLDHAERDFRLNRKFGHYHVLRDEPLETGHGSPA